MVVDILYFAWVREAVGVGQERLEIPPEVETIAGLLRWLATLDAGHAAAFANPGRIRAAVDDSFVGPDAPLAGAREIALFPPVTGG